MYYRKNISEPVVICVILSELITTSIRSSAKASHTSQKFTKIECTKWAEKICLYATKLVLKVLRISNDTTVAIVSPTTKIRAANNVSFFL